MTVVVCLKVYEGMVVGADSTTTAFRIDDKGQAVVVNTYDNANKIINLHKDLPLGLATWGVGGIGTASIPSLAKDLRYRFMLEPSDAIEPRDYGVEEVAKRTRRFFFDEKFKAAYPSSPPSGLWGFVVFGVSANADHAEAWMFEIRDGKATEPSCVLAQNAVGALCYGQPEAVFRLLRGVDVDGMFDFLKSKGMSDEDARGWIVEMLQRFSKPMIDSAMPLQDAIDLVRFLVDLTCRCSRFWLGPQTVGGPIDIATVTKHEHFKWVQRKHFYDMHLNPERRAT